MARPPGLLPCGCAVGLRGFPTAPPCAGGKLARIPSGHPADFPSPARRAIGVLVRAARSQRALFRRARAEQQQSAAQAWRSAVAIASGAHDARLLFRGPSAAVSRGRQGRAAGIAMEGDAFSPGQESRRKARPRLTDFPPKDGRKATPRGGLLFWLLFSWPRKRKGTRAPAGARNRSDASNAIKSKAPLQPCRAASPANGRGDSACVSSAQKTRETPPPPSRCPHHPRRDASPAAAWADSRC